jgi:ABC-type dipeptide/oligopeptide/nickel transport system permease component
VTTNVLIGSFIIERVFALPGLGQWFVTGVLNRDYPVIGGLTIFYSTLLLSIHTLIDIINTLVDPRILPRKGLEKNKLKVSAYATV